MKKYVAAAAFAAAFVATPALAQDGPAPVPTSGPRVEATVGWDHIVLGVDGDNGTKSGVTFGGELGYDIRTSGGAVIGAYAGIDGASTKDCLSDGTERACVKAGRNITVGARVGGSIGLGSLVYVKGGYSNGRLEIDYRDSAFPTDNFNEGGNADGFHVGAGAEFGFSRGVYGKVEYNFTKYSTDDDGTGFDVDLERHRVVAGVGVRF